MRAGNLASCNSDDIIRPLSGGGSVSFRRGFVGFIFRWSSDEAVTSSSIALCFGIDNFAIVRYMFLYVLSREIDPCMMTHKLSHPLIGR